MAVTADDVKYWFIDAGMDPDFELGLNQDPSVQARYDRIAEEINSGTKTVAEKKASIAMLGDRGGTMSPAKQAAQAADAAAAKLAAEIAAQKAENRQTFNLVYAWLPEGARSVFVDEYVESGNSEAGWAKIRQDSRYEDWFPGNLTPDGRVRYSEDVYEATVEGFRDVYRAYGLNSNLLNGRIGNLIGGEVSPSEFAARVNNVWTRVVSASEHIKRYYAGAGRSVTDQALLAGALDPELGDQILDQRISNAEIGGEALGSGFRLSEARVDMLRSEGMNKTRANQIFGDAERLVPVLDVLSKRHNDPDDDFDINNFVSAEFFKDPEQTLRMQRMITQERMSFRNRLSLRQSQSGALTGLLAE